VLEVRDGGPQSPEQPGHPDSHAQDLAARGQLDGLDSVGHELRAPRHRGKAKALRARKLGEQVAHICLVAGALASEDIGIDEDERIAHAAASR
jgi:hypothetical protein